MPKRSDASRNGTWQVQQAFPISKYPPADGAWFALTEKLNGIRATMLNGVLYARSGNPFCGMEHITNAMRKMSAGIVWDGELVLAHRRELGLSDNEAFRKAAGIANSNAASKTQLCFMVFDSLPADEFLAGRSSKTYRERRSEMDMWFRYAQIDPGIAQLVPVLYEGTDQSMIRNLLDRMIREDKEGLMLNLDVPYECRRHRGILKIKRFYTMDLPITGCEEGTGRLSGTLGALILNYKGNELRVGSGFTDEERADLWSRQAGLPGTLCEVKYKEMSRDKKTGAESLQFPIFVSLRTDKSEVSFG